MDLRTATPYWLLKSGLAFGHLAEEPTFDLNSKVEHTDLTEINDMFKAFGGFDVNKGTFGMYAEVAAKDGIIYRICEAVD